MTSMNAVVLQESVFVSFVDCRQPRPHRAVVVSINVQNPHQYENCTKIKIIRSHKEPLLEMSKKKHY